MGQIGKPNYRCHAVSYPCSNEFFLAGDRYYLN
jgi:hypothetical protein